MGAAAAAAPARKAAGGGESCRVAVVAVVVCSMMDLDRSFGFRCLRFFLRAEGSDFGVRGVGLCSTARGVGAAWCSWALAGDEAC